MAALSDFKRGQIAAARKAGASVTKTAKLFGVAWSIVSKVVKTSEKEGKIPSQNQNSGKARAV